MHGLPNSPRGFLSTEGQLKQLAFLFGLFCNSVGVSRQGAKKESSLCSSKKLHHVLNDERIATQEAML